MNPQVWVEEDEDVFVEEEDEPESIVSLMERRRGRSARPRGGYGQGIAGSRGGTLSTPAGSAQVQFQKSLVTTTEFKEALAKVEADIKKQASSIQLVDERHASIAKRQSKKLNNVQQMAMLMTFLQPKPQLGKLEVDLGTPQIPAGAPAGTASTGTVYTVKNTEYKSGDNMLPLVLLMSGGLGGEKGEEDSMMNLLMILAISGGLGKTG